MCIRDRRVDEHGTDAIQAGRQLFGDLFQQLDDVACSTTGQQLSLIHIFLLFDILNISREICYSLAGMRNPG